MRLSCDGDLTLLHNFKQSALNFGGRSVDFIGQQKIGKDGSQHGAELAGLLVEDACADQVSGQQIRRELDATETAVEGFGQCVDGQCFGKAGNTFNEQMPLCQQSNQDAL